MSEAAPEHADTFAANAVRYIAELEALDADTRACLAELLADKRTVVTAHDPFGYLADAYDMTFLAPVGIDSEAEPSARDLATLISQLKETGAAALFVENITSPALVQQISDETDIDFGGLLEALADTSS
ncbi:MAG: metal ABC transporter substrate-binding protein [Pseudomonadota bacterium]